MAETAALELRRASTEIQASVRRAVRKLEGAIVNYRAARVGSDPVRTRLALVNMHAAKDSLDSVARVAKRSVESR